MKAIRTIGVLVLILGIVGIGIGGTFIGLGMARSNQVAETLRAEKVTVGLDADAVAKGQVVDTMAEAQKAAETLGEHRKSLAPTYGDLLAGGRFDPTKPAQLTYAQAMNLQNYFFTAVIAFGLTQVTMASGAFMIVGGLALGGTGITLYKLSKKIA